MKDGFADSIDEIKKIALEYATNLQVRPCKKVYNERGEYEVERSHYCQEKNAIYLDERKDDEEYAITFRHEYGHFIDAQLGRPSLKENFSMAIQADFFWYDRNTLIGSENLQKMLKELEQEEIFDSRYFSDILSGMFHNDRIIRECYDRNGVAFYSHSNYYWAGLKGPQNAVEREIFANLVALYAENNEEIVNFFEKHFPNISKQFKKELHREING